MFERRLIQVVALIGTVGVGSRAWAKPLVEVSKPQIRFDRNARDQRDLTVSFDATFDKKPPGNWELSVKARCVIGEKKFVDSGGVMDTLDGLDAGDTKRFSALLFNLVGDNPLPGRTTDCEFSILFGKILSSSPGGIATFCYGNDAIEPGKCVTAAERAREEEKERKRQEKEQVVRDRAAFQTSTRSCSQGDMGACADLGTMYKLGSGVGKNIAKAEELYLKSCRGGTSAGCEGLDALGVLYQSSDDRKPDLKAAARVFGFVCDGKNASGCDHLGLLYRNGTGVAKDLDRASDLFERACKGRSGEHCDELIRLGKSYEKGDGVPADDKKAALIYQRACDAKSQLGCVSVGVMYLDGRGVTASVAKAEELLRAACSTTSTGDGDDVRAVIGDSKTNEPNGCALLVRVARAYESGNGVGKDEAKAATLYEETCRVEPDERGEACMSLASMYKDGRGVPKDKEKARINYERACNAKIQQACVALKTSTIDEPKPERPPDRSPTTSSPMTSTPLIPPPQPKKESHWLRNVGVGVVIAGVIAVYAYESGCFSSPGCSK